MCGLMLCVALQMSSVLQAAVNEIMSEMEKAPADRRDELKRKMRKIVGDDRLEAMGIPLDSLTEAKATIELSPAPVLDVPPTDTNDKVCNWLEAYQEV